MSIPFDKRPPTYPTLQLRGKAIKFSDTIKYFGVYFSPNMHFAEHCHHVANSARRMIGAFRRKFGKFATSALKTVYQQCILPRLDYGAIIYSPTEKDKG